MSGASLGIGLALFAAVATALPHFLWKAAGDRLVVRAVIGGTYSAIMWPVALAIGLPPADLWPWLAASAALHLTYQMTLVYAYDRIDFSLAFPVARGLAPLGTAVLGVALLGDRLAPLALLGIALVSVGLLVLSRSRAGAGGTVGRAGLISALAAGLLVTAYSLVDAGGVRADNTRWTFIAWMFALDGIGMVVIAGVLRRGELCASLAKVWRGGVMSGLFALLGYGAILLAYDLIPVGVASALREMSVVFAALLGAVFLRERVRGRRAWGIAMGLAGSLLILAARLA